MSDIDALRAIAARQADDGDRDLLAALTQDETSRVIGMSDHVVIGSYVDAGGASHCTETALHSRTRPRT